MKPLAPHLLSQFRRMVGSDGQGENAWVELLPQPTLVVDDRFHIRGVNEAFYEHFGFSRGRDAGLHLQDFDQGRWDASDVRALIQQALLHPGISERQLIWRRFAALGDVALEITARAKDRQAGEAMVVLSLQDVTALYQEAMLAVSLTQSSLDCVKLLDLDGNILHMNDNGFVQMELEDVNACVGTPWAAFWRGAHKEKADMAFAQAKQGHTSRFEGFCATLKGSPRWWEVIVSPVLGAEGRPVKLLCISRDITERRTNEEVLRDRERQWRALAEAMPQLVWMCRSDGVCEYLSGQWGHYTGVPEDTLLGARWLEVLHPDDRDRAASAWNDAVAGVADYDLEYRIRRFDGSYRWFRTRGVPIHDEMGKTLRWYGTCTDIQETAEAREAAEAANIAKSEFLANMSHELRTPMNAVVGLANILSNSKPLTEKQHEFISTLCTSADSLLALINDLLDISKIEAATVELECIAFRLEQTIDDAVSMVAMRAREKGLALRVDTAMVAGRAFMGDPKRIRQIVLNLCSNAVKFTDKGEVRLTVGCSEGEPCMIEIVVEDTGIGIAADKRESVFQKFVQADSSIGRKYGGTGLGLAITQQLVGVMGGDISVESAEGVGSRFVVRLPLSASPLQPEMVVEAARPKVEEGQHRHVLLVEDYAPNVMVATSFLELFGYSCDVANNGAEALAYIQGGGAYRAVLMDVQMQGMDGLETTRRVRAFEQEMGRRPLHIIGMTAHALAGDRERCLAVGMDDYISKPFNPDELEHKLANCLKADRKVA